MEFFAGFCFGAIVGIIFIMAVYHSYEKKAIKDRYVNLAGTIYSIHKIEIKNDSQ